MKAFVLLGLAFTAGTGAAMPAAPSTACVRLAADLERAEQARQSAIDKGDNAWKTVLPFAVIARKASSKAAADEAAKQIDELRQQARREGCDAP